MEGIWKKRFSIEFLVPFGTKKQGFTGSQTIKIKRFSDILSFSLP